MKIWTLFKIWKSFNKLMKNLIYLFLILILLTELVFKQIPTPYYFFYTFGNIFLTLSYSIVASIIAYFFTCHFPNEYRKIRLVKYLNNLSCEICTDIYFLASNLKNNNGCMCDPIEVENLMKVKYPSVYDYIVETSNRIRKNINNILTFSSLLSDRSIQSLTLIDVILNGDLDFTSMMKKKEFQTVESILPKIKDLECKKQCFHSSIKKELHLYLSEHEREYFDLI